MHGTNPGSLQVQKKPGSFILSFSNFGGVWMATELSHLTMLLGLWALMPSCDQLPEKSMRRWSLSLPQFSAPPKGQEIRNGVLLQISRLLPHLFTIQQALSIAHNAQALSRDHVYAVWRQIWGSWTELSKEENQVTQESGPAEKPQKLTVLDWAHFWPKSWGPRQEAGASKRWGPLEKIEAPPHQSAAETGLWAVWGCWWSGDIPASNFWDRWGCWRSSCPSLVSCRFTTKKILSNLFFGPQSAVSPWEFGRSVAQTFHRQTGMYLSLALVSCGPNTLLRKP